MGLATETPKSVVTNSFIVPALIADLGEAANWRYVEFFTAATPVKTPPIDALVETVRNMTGKDFAAEARTLEGLGLGGMDGHQIRHVIEKGFS